MFEISLTESIEATAKFRQYRSLKFITERNELHRWSFDEKY
jgi:hypothetical protein